MGSIGRLLYLRCVEEYKESLEMATGGPVFCAEGHTEEKEKCHLRKSEPRTEEETGDKVVSIPA